MNHSQRPGPSRQSRRREETEPRNLSGVDIGGPGGERGLYRVNPLVKGAQPLLIGTIPEKKPEPVAWTFIRADGGKSFYTSLGHPNDFKEPAFRKLLANALHWAASK